MQNFNLNLILKEVLNTEILIRQLIEKTSYQIVRNLKLSFNVFKLPKNEYDIYQIKEQNDSVHILSVIFSYEYYEAGEWLVDKNILNKRYKEGIPCIVKVNQEEYYSSYSQDLDNLLEVIQKNMEQRLPLICQMIEKNKTILSNKHYLWFNESEQQFFINTHIAKIVSVLGHDDGYIREISFPIHYNIHNDNLSLFDLYKNGNFLSVRLLKREYDSEIKYLKMYNDIINKYQNIYLNEGDLK